MTPCDSYTKRLESHYAAIMARNWSWAKVWAIYDYCISLSQRMGKQADADTRNHRWVAKSTSYLALLGAHLQLPWYHGTDARGRKVSCSYLLDPKPILKRMFHELNCEQNGVTLFLYRLSVPFEPLLNTKCKEFFFHVVLFFLFSSLLVFFHFFFFVVRSFLLLFY